MNQGTSCTGCGGTTDGDERAVCDRCAARPAPASPASPASPAGDPQTVVIRAVAVVAPGSPAGVPQERLIRPVLPPEQGPNPGDVAMFTDTAPIPRVVPGELARDSPGADAPNHGVIERRVPAPLVYAPAPPWHGEEDRAAHRKPRSRGRVAALAGGAVAAVVGCTAVAASLIGGRAAGDNADRDADPGPSIALPDGQGAPDVDEETTGPEPAEELTEETTPVEAPVPEPLPVEPEPVEEEAPVVEEPTPESPPEEPEPTEESPVDPAPPSEAPDPGAAPEEPGVLAMGADGPAVRDLQERLGRLGGHFRVDVTGSYDQATFDSVARFQDWFGVWNRHERGVYCALTRERLEAVTDRNRDGR
ncbi:peptidoglycan-binding domain-containing protein [Streptomyces sp. ST2-7A]|uniref:peptidoglycan-binding domain-containing protein n=1 Tax=Streptomyces sp. ST2-7A TaxID=2907214 RepID=UPI001F4501B7|nr:peptidoglycan-binding domain-containing protein [Streptomyces sp. ST2-7A]MCE7081332.1 peptidoglycan-binding protein [Streptomyces sp. ST2-7A]